MKEVIKPTAGSQYIIESQKELPTNDVVELSQEMIKKNNYEQAIRDAVNDGLKKYIGDFYVVALTKQERLMDKFIRSFTFHRKSCPTPENDQIVYQYHRGLDSLSLLWVIPSQDACHYLKNNAVLVHPEERELLNYVLDYADGTLFKKCKVLNGEQLISPLLEGR